VFRRRLWIGIPLIGVNTLLTLATVSQ